MTRMAHLAGEQNELIVQLTERASRDTDAVKTLTLLASAYLPASFVAVSTPSSIHAFQASKQIESLFGG